MATFLARRGLSLLFVLFSLTFLTFVVGRLAPGDPVQRMMGNRHDPVRHAELVHQYGLDRPIWTQYLDYMTGLVQGDLGLSYQYPGRHVSEMLARGVPVSFGLGALALLISVGLGVPVGIIAATHRNRWSDRLLMGLMLILFSVPSFVLIPILRLANLQVFRAGLPTLPMAGWGRPEDWVFPVTVLAAASTGYIARLTRGSMLEVLRQDYIRTAESKGLPHRVVVGRHALRNALLPLVTFLGPSVAFLVTGAFIVESLFDVPGIGFLAVQSISQRDYPVIQATTLLLGFAVVVMNLLTDGVYLLLDPRIRKS
jgi:peptide/nickel transport system permease protein/oligopeptide transport system permease protein